MFQVERLTLDKEAKKEEPVDGLIHKKRQNEVRVSGLKLNHWNKMHAFLQAILACRSNTEALESEQETIGNLTYMSLVKKH